MQRDDFGLHLCMQLIVASSSLNFGGARAVVYLSCKPFGLNIKMNFIASIKGHKDDRQRKFDSKVFFFCFLGWFFLSLSVFCIASIGCNQTIYKTHCVRSLETLTQPIKSCILRLSLGKKRARPNITWMCGFFLLFFVAFDDFFSLLFALWFVWFGKSFQHFEFSFFLALQKNTCEHCRINERTEKLASTKWCDSFFIISYGFDRMTNDLLANKHWARNLYRHTHTLTLARTKYSQE